MKNILTVSNIKCLCSKPANTLLPKTADHHWRGSLRKPLFLCFCWVSSSLKTMIHIESKTQAWVDFLYGSKFLPECSYFWRVTVKVVASCSKKTFVSLLSQATPTSIWKQESFPRRISVTPSVCEVSCFWWNSYVWGLISVLNICLYGFTSHALK